MPILAPPRPPVLVSVEDDGLGRVHFRLFQIVMTALTIFATVWVSTFGIIPAILALMVAKHVLVAILVQAMDYHRVEVGKPSVGRPEILRMKEEG